MLAGALALVFVIAIVSVPIAIISKVGDFLKSKPDDASGHPSQSVPMSNRPQGRWRSDHKSSGALAAPQSPSSGVTHGQNSGSTVSFADSVTLARVRALVDGARCKYNPSNPDHVEAINQLNIEKIIVGQTGTGTDYVLF
jgi:hypothetical protein